MAQKQITVSNNNNGQALVEALGMMSITGVFLYLLLYGLIRVIFSVALDSMAEDYFFCELARKPSCEEHLKTRLRQNQMKNVSVSIKKPGHKIILTISATHLASMTITREFDYEDFRKQL